jgi:starvation-inducible DNA-binding protein
MPTRNGNGSQSKKINFTVPGMKTEDATKTIELLQDRLNALLDLALTLKHIHWNVVGPHFIGVHEMLDPQYKGVSLMADAAAERIAALGGSPIGTPGAIAKMRSWDDYALRRDTADAHLAALDIVYGGVVRSHREAIEAVGELDPVTEDLLVQQAGELEQYHWFVRAHLETGDGTLITAGATDERSAATAAASIGH